MELRGSELETKFLLLAGHRNLAARKALSDHSAPSRLLAQVLAEKFDGHQGADD
jgi:hypothetical protein